MRAALVIEYPASALEMNAPSPVRTAFKSFHPMHECDQAPDVPRIAISVPAAGVDNVHRFVKRVTTVQECENHDAVIWNNMAVA